MLAIEDCHWDFLYCSYYGESQLMKILILPEDMFPIGYMQTPAFFRMPTLSKIHRAGLSPTL